MKGQIVTEPIHVNGLLTGSQLGTWQPNFQLTEAKFEYLMNGKPEIYKWSSGIFLATIGYGFGVASKLISNFFTETQQKVTIGEWGILAIGALISLILLVIGLLFFDDKRKRVKREIEQHFKNEEGTLLIGRGGE